MTRELLQSFALLCRESFERVSKKFFEERLKQKNVVDEAVKISLEAFYESLTNVLLDVTYPDVQSKRESWSEFFTSHVTTGLQNDLQSLSPDFLEKDEQKLNLTYARDLYLLAKVLTEKTLITFDEAFDVLVHLDRKFVGEGYAQYVLRKKVEFYKRVVRKFCEFFVSTSASELLRRRLSETRDPRLAFTPQFVSVISALWPKNEVEEEVVFSFLRKVKPVYESLTFIEALTLGDLQSPIKAKRDFLYEDFFHGIRNENAVELLSYLKEAVDYVLDEVALLQNWDHFVKVESVLACALYSAIGLEKECLKGKVLLATASWKQVKYLGYVVKYLQKHQQVEKEYALKVGEKEAAAANEAVSRALKALRRFVRVFVENEDFFDWTEEKKRSINYEVRYLLEDFAFKVGYFFESLLEDYESNEDVYYVVKRAKKRVEELELTTACFERSINLVRSEGLAILKLVKDLASSGAVKKELADVVGPVFVTSVTKKASSFYKDRCERLAYKNHNEESATAKEIDYLLRLTNELLSKHEEEVKAILHSKSESLFSKLLRLSELFKNAFEKAYQQLLYQEVKEEKREKEVKTTTSLTTQVSP